MIYLIILGWLACGILSFYMMARSEKYSLKSITYGQASLAVFMVCGGYVSLQGIVIASIGVWIIENIDKPVFKKKIDKPIFKKK